MTTAFGREQLLPLNELTSNLSQKQYEQAIAEGERMLALAPNNAES